jgi:hypothetical protein
VERCTQARRILPGTFSLAPPTKLGPTDLLRSLVNVDLVSVAVTTKSRHSVGVWFSRIWMMSKGSAVGGACFPVFGLYEEASPFYRRHSSFPIGVPFPFVSISFHCFASSTQARPFLN